MSQPSFVVDHATRDTRARPEPLGAGFFGQRGTVEAHIIENRDGDCPSLDEFEARYGDSELPRRKNGA